MKNINQWTKKDFLSLREIEWNEDIGEFNSLVILPTNHVHDSGFRQMDFVAVKDNEPICRISGCSDVIHIDGIGVLGLDWQKKEPISFLITAKGWSIDCLKKSGLLRLFSDTKLIADPPHSSFCIYSTEREE